MSMNTPRSPLSRSIRVALLLAASLLLLLVPTIAAQDDANEAHPAHITPAPVISSATLSIRWGILPLRAARRWVRPAGIWSRSAR